MLWNGKKLSELPVATERLRGDIQTILNHLNGMTDDCPLPIAMDCAYRVYRELARRVVERRTKGVGGITRWDSTHSLTGSTNESIQRKEQP
jgi:hypothetical protein